MKDPSRKRSPDLFLAETSELAALLQIYYLKCCRIRCDPKKTLLYFCEFQALPKEFRFPCFGLDPSLGIAPTFPFLGDFRHEIVE